ncbi:DUF309 domain-containing protein [Effusibacillus dendaii]|uniref:DUF309 domain-containing protein n=1 Tax=Effusibacillus dendaii TaxID=2743772 RepID=A0A7I8DE18_9BACL|nr:DUF309 domain-containing protein [Effusibacillus dendaii]BCJ88453.1 hypothetical protein skT53_34380 [Effusibacillus dendaii]
MKGCFDMEESIPQELLDYVQYMKESRYFDAHEVLEELWHSDRNDFYKGLIQIAVALFHLRNGNIKGARHLFKRARHLLTPCLPAYRRVDVRCLIDYLNDCLQVIPDVTELERNEVERLGIQNPHIVFNNLEI